MAKLTGQPITGNWQEKNAHSEMSTYTSSHDGGITPTHFNHQQTMAY